MLDSFNNKFAGDENFCPFTYLTKLIEGSKIELRFEFAPRFPSGWTKVIDELIETIKKYPVVITHIYDIHTVLIVKFEMSKSSKELIVWRAIDKAQSESELICVMCGEGKSRKRISERLCESCNKNAAKINQTQTWLDKY